MLSEQDCGGVEIQAGHGDGFGRPGQGEQLSTFPAGHHHRHRVGVQTPAGERQGVGRGPVNPLGIVDNHHYRLILGRNGEQFHGGRTEREAVLDPPIRFPQDSSDAALVGVGQLAHVAQQRSQQKLQPGQSQIGRAVHPRRPDHSAALASFDRVLAECGLAGTRFAHQPQDACVALPGPLDGLVDPGALGGPP
jgi:hypothetical protein